MAKVRAGAIDIEYESFGDGPPLVLIMGLAAPLTFWPDEFCALLAQRGFRVIRFDHRDTGMSSKLTDAPVPNIYRVIARTFLGLPVDVPYTLLDMADDVAGLLDGLSIEAAHIVGVSMGGMIGQMMAIAYPHRVLTLTSMASSPGHRLSLIGHERWVCCSNGSREIANKPSNAGYSSS